MATSALSSSPGVWMSVAGEVDLEAGDAGQGAGRGADLGGEVGEGADVVAEEGRGVGELRAGELHAVAGVAGEADGDGFDLFDLARMSVGGAIETGGRGGGRRRAVLGTHETVSLEQSASGPERRPAGLRVGTRVFLSYCATGSRVRNPAGWNRKPQGCQSIVLGSRFSCSGRGSDSPILMPLRAFRETGWDWGAG